MTFQQIIDRMDVSMKSTPETYEFWIEGHLSPEWSEWLDGLSIINLPDGNTVISGRVPDQAALYGLIDRFRDLNLKLVKLCRI